MATDPGLISTNPWAANQRAVDRSDAPCETRVIASAISGPSTGCGTNPRRDPTRGRRTCPSSQRRTWSQPAPPGHGSAHAHPYGRTPAVCRPSVRARCSARARNRSPLRRDSNSATEPMICARMIPSAVDRSTSPPITVTIPACGANSAVIRTRSVSRRYNRSEAHTTNTSNRPAAASAIIRSNSGRGEPRHADTSLSS